MKAEMKNDIENLYKTAKIAENGSTGVTAHKGQGRQDDCMVYPCLAMERHRHRVMIDRVRISIWCYQSPSQAHLRNQLINAVLPSAMQLLLSLL
jgi:hypothetical protein